MHPHAPGSPSGYDRSGTLSPSIPPTVDSISNDESDPALAAGGGTGYVPLSALGVAPQSGFGDDTLVTFNVPSYKYGSEAYTKLGVSSNGYLVVGGQTASADNNCCSPQHFPDTAKPNNTLAAFWTDLNATPAVLPPGGGVYVALLNDGAPGDRWIVVDWEKIPVFGTGRLQNFEIWIRYAPQPVEYVTYEYGDMTYPGAGNNATDPAQGAENRTGTSGQNVTQPVADNSSYSIHTSPPTPGGSVTITYDVKGKKPGSYTLTTNMTSDQVPGTTVTKQPLTVT